MHINAPNTMGDYKCQEENDIVQDGRKTSAEIQPDARGDDALSIPVKPEYILQSRASSLPPLHDTSFPNNGESNGGKKKYKKKKRPRDQKIEAADKMCLKMVRDETCPFGDTCRFSHNFKAFLADRPDDLPIEEGCPIYERDGYCPFGVTCRVAGSHINQATGENLGKQSSNDGKRTDPECNHLPKDIQTQLRKNGYPFRCKRYNQRPENDLNESRDHNSQDSHGVASSHGPDEVMHQSQIGQREGSPRQQSSITSEIANVSHPKDGRFGGITPMPARQKKIDFTNKVYVAPLTTVGNLPFRRIMKHYGADITCGEMALATELLQGKSSEWALLKRHASEDAFGVQIAAAYADQFTRACELIENHTTVDFVDLNLGCPIDLVCSKGAGAALMLRDAKIRSTLESITRTLSCSVTVKMRTGWDMERPLIPKLVPKIQSWQLSGVDALMIHGRSRLQRYSKEANWDLISEAALAGSNNGNVSLNHTRIPIIGNGDIYSYVDYENKVLGHEGLSSCAMLARGALIKPWLPAEIKERRHWDISATERLDMLKSFVRFGLEHWGSDQQGVNNVRRYLLEWLSFLHPYVPVGLLERVPVAMNQRPPQFMCGRSDLETLMLSDAPSDWIKITEMLLGPPPEGFQFEPKHRAKNYKGPEG